MSLIAQKLISASGATEETDDSFSLVTSLYHFDGSNGAQNNTLLDSSSESHTVTRNADIVQGTFSPFSAEEGKWAAEFPVGEAGNQINPASGLGSADFALGTGAFTIEAWVFVTADNYPYSRIMNIGPYWNSANSVALLVNDTDNSNKISLGVYAASTSGRVCVSTNATPENEWFHVAVTRDSTGDFRLFVNGNLDSTNTSYRTVNVSSLGDPALAIGNGVNRAVEEPFEGYISNFRLVKGTAVYTSSFTVPTEPLTAITNTKLLTCCGNRFRDKSTSAHSITLTGSPKIKPFSPFAPSYSYSASVNGGSGFFDGTSDCYLTVSDATDFDFGTGDYTLEAWVYPTINVTAIGQFNLPFAITGGNNYWGWTSYGSGYNGLTNHVDTLDSNSGADSENPDMFGWNHIVYQVTSGTNNWYKNGVQVYSGSAATHADATGFQVGRSPSYSNHYYGGYISDVRIIKGSNAYSNASTLTVPTTPLTAVTNTKLLLNFTNAAMFDQTGKSNIDTVYASLDTSVKKFGTASVEFDGTDDYIEVPPSTAISPQRGSWTYECFIYPKLVADASGYGCIFDTRTNNPGTDGVSLFYVGTATQKRLECYGPAAGGYYFATANNSITLDQWQHVALVFDLDATNYPITCYVNGTSVGSSTSNTWYTRNSGRLRIGAQQAGYNEFTGFIDEFRVTNKARYTSNFTAPTKEFPNL